MSFFKKYILFLMVLSVNANLLCASSFFVGDINDRNQAALQQLVGQVDCMQAILNGRDLEAPRYEVPPVEKEEMERRNELLAELSAHRRRGKSYKHDSQLYRLNLQSLACSIRDLSRKLIGFDNFYDRELMAMPIDREKNILRSADALEYLEEQVTRLNDRMDYVKTKDGRPVKTNLSK